MNIHVVKKCNRALSVCSLPTCVAKVFVHFSRPRVFYEEVALRRSTRYHKTCMQ